MIFNDKWLKIKLERVEEHSIKLANDIYSCHQRFISNRKKWKKTESAFASNVVFFVNKLQVIIDLLDSFASQKLLANGLSALDDNTVWAQLEYASLASSKYGKSTKNGLFYLVCIHNDNPELLPPSKVNIKGYITDISNLYKASLQLFTEYRDILTLIIKSDKLQMYLRNFKHTTYGVLVKLIQNDENRYLLGRYGLKAFAMYNNILETAMEYPKYNSVHFQLMLSSYDSEIFKRKTILVRDKHKVDLTDLFKQSPALYEDIKCYSNVISHTFGRDLKFKTILDRFSAFKRALLILQAILPNELYESLLVDGMHTLIRNDGVLKQLYENTSLPKRAFQLIYEICKSVHPEQTPELISFQDNTLSFPGVDSNRNVLSDFSLINHISERLFKDFSDLLDRLKISIKQENYSMVTVHHNYQQAKSLIIKYRESFTQQHLDILIDHGIKGFGVDDCMIQKHLFCELQKSVYYNSLNRMTAKGYRSGLEWFLKAFEVPFSNSYPIKLAKTAKHNQRLNTDDFYTESECRELAFYIEKELSKNNTSLHHKVLLCFGKVLLKTAWNISPLLKLECEDIVEVDSPITNKAEYAVVLQKARAGYRSDTYTFSKNELKANALKSAIMDLLEVRDVLTKDLRKQAKDNNFVFIYPRNGKVLKLEYQSVKQLSPLLKKAGCKVPFVASKIRKGGVNHIYRKVQKNIKNYINIVHHSFSVFESNYLRIEPDKSRYSLNQATQIMGEYFTGKEISSDIQIITDISVSKHQIVPSGACVANNNNEEAERYNREHRKLHQDNDTGENQFCADFLSCVWCKYFRVVVDSEHVWKLLSYKNYILQDMRMSFVGLDDDNQQVNSINILKQRVDDIISHLRKRNNKAVEEGFMLLERHGIHTDWEFACPTTSALKGE